METENEKNGKVKMEIVEEKKLENGLKVKIHFFVGEQEPANLGDKVIVKYAVKFPSDPENLLLIHPELRFGQRCLFMKKQMQSSYYTGLVRTDNIVYSVKELRKEILKEINKLNRKVKKRKEAYEKAFAYLK